MTGRGKRFLIYVFDPHCSTDIAVIFVRCGVYYRFPDRIEHLRAYEMNPQNFEHFGKGSPYS